ncbi:nitric oxide synthase oxygenase [Radiobacillus sp. PE A8.2]|uniref:nitric oxide synthase oxygenase n=1 Tax=Radiobacillus sp. PE A8.2 TaxID=3380349 RepID=UPI00388E12FC
MKNNNLQRLENAELIQEAASFIRTCYFELGKNEIQIEQRIDEVISEINETGTYKHSFEELSHGAKMAWRNSNRCIGRLFWNRLKVIDAREITEASDVFDLLFKHIVFATNNGKVQSAITIFNADAGNNRTVRIWNHQLLRYAGYQTADGIIGDPASVAFTERCMELGWEGKFGAFDILPLVVQIDEDEPQWMDIPADIIVEVVIEHPNHDLFGEREVKWYAVPIIADMRLEIGGINYGCAPFNGWYMGTEIGARNLADTDRYNLLPAVAEHLGLDTNSNRSLWKDEALVELNKAVLQSFQKAGVTIVDHHTAAQQFKMFEEKEAKAERELTGRWSWLIPPLSPASTHIFHSHYDDLTQKPNFFHQ